MKNAAATLLMGAGLALTSCSSESQLANVPPTSELASSPTTMTASSSSTDQLDPTTSPPDTEPTVPPTWMEPTRVVELPAGAAPLSVAVGPEVAMVLSPASLSQPPTIWTTAMPAPVSMAALLPDAQLMNNGSWWGTASVIYFEGRYFAFVVGDVAADDLVPTALVSSDAIAWEPFTMTVQMNASLERRRTPESPPYEGASAILDVAVLDDRITATGWANVGDGIQPVVWESTDGDVWRLTIIGSGSVCPEYGSQVAATGDLTVVELGGCTYYGAGAQLSVSSEPFTFVVDYLDQGALSVTRLIGVSDGKLTAIRTGFDPEVQTGLRVLDVGGGWIDRPLPDTGENDVNWSGLADDSVGVVVWVTSLDGAPTFFWQMRDSGWLPLTLDGSTIVAATDDHLVTLDGDQLLFYRNT